jgi:hypothetical protein
MYEDELFGDDYLESNMIGYTKGFEEHWVWVGKRYPPSQARERVWKMINGYEVFDGFKLKKTCKKVGCVNPKHAKEVKKIIIGRR